MVELERNRYDRAAEICAELSVIAGKLREGSEAPFALALDALIGYARGKKSGDALQQAFHELRMVDAKHRLAYVLTRAAELDVQHGHAELARRRAEEALAIAELLERPTERARCRLVLARVALELGDREDLESQLSVLAGADFCTASSHARRAIEALLIELGRAGAAGASRSDTHGERLKRSNATRTTN
jgi:hypothetical protein